MYLGIAASLGLLVLNFLGIFGLANLLLALYVVLFVPGFVVLRIIKLRCSILEALVLSFGLSLAITGLFATPLLRLAEGSRALIVAIGYSLFSTVPIIIERSAGNHSERLDTHEQRGEVINVASLVTIVLLFTLICGTIYPVASHAPVDDILAHWRSSRLISRSPEVYSSTYPWFHILESTIYALSRPSMAAFMSVLTFLSVLLVLTFYVLANKYLKDVDSSLPIFATMIWFLFSGFGWLHYIQMSIPHQTVSRAALLWIVSDRSYWDTLFGQGPWLWLFLRPLTLGFLLLFTLLFLLKLKNLKSLRFTLVFSILTMALGLIHIPELLVFIAVLFIASVFTPQLDLRLKEAWLSTFIGLIGISAIVYILSTQGVMVGIPQSLFIALAPVSLLGWYMTSRSWGGVKIKIGQGFVKWICTIVLIVFLAGLLSWLSSAQDFAVELVGSWAIPSSAFVVPWHLYPVLLGVTGLIFVLGLTDIGKVLRKNRNLVLFVFMALVALFIGRLESFTNTYYFPMFYYCERRFVPFVFASISLIVPIPILKVVRNWVKVKGVAYATLLIGLLVLAGTSSTFLSIEYWNHSVYRENARVAEENWGAINYLYRSFEEEPNSRIFTVTSRSEWELGFAAPRLIVDPLADPLWIAKYPEMPLWILQGAYPAYDSPYIYLHDRDMIELQDRFANTFMYCAASSIFSPIYQDSVARVIHLPRGSVPSPNSSVALVMPYNYNEETAWAYSLVNTLLSLGGYSYTTLHEMDSRIQDEEVLLVPLDDSRTLESLLQKTSERTNSKLIVFNTCGSDHFAQHFMIGETKLSITSVDDLITSVNTIYPIEGIATIRIRNDKSTVKCSAVTTDNHTSFWKPTPYGSGNIGLAVLKDDPAVKTEGVNGLRLEVGEGKNAQWQITHIYDNPQDFSEFDFLMFDWYGHGDNKRYIVEICAPDVNNYFWYEFLDDWQGWRRVLIPLDMPEGSHKAFGVQICKVDKGNPSWDEVETMNIRLSAVNPNLEGIWFIDNIGLDMGRWVTINATIGVENGTPVRLRLLNDVGAETASVLVKLGAQETLHAGQVYYMDGTRADTIFGSQSIIKARLGNVSNQTRLTLSLKMPPVKFGYNEVDQFQLVFDISFPVQGTEATKLVSAECDRELLLPTAIRVPSASFTNKTQVLGWYLGEKCRMPLATRWNISGMEVTYVNIYPIAQAVRDKVEINLYETFPELLEIIGLSLPKQRDYSPEDLLNLLVFREASFRGSITLEADSIIFQPSQNISCLTLHLKEEHKQIRGANDILVNGIERACVFGDRMAIGKGMGFYSSIRFHNSSIAMEGANLLVELQYKNGSRQHLEGEREIMITIPDSVILLARTPQVEVNGTASFEEAYGLQTVFDTLRASGQDVNITGHVEFKLLLSDEYSIAKNVIIEGMVDLNPPILQWDELESIKSSIIWFIVAALIVLPLSAINTKLRNVKIKLKIGRD